MDDRLDSWKDIAAYLGREVRTVQGWEKNEGLPVHRHQHARQGSVYAFKLELDSWRKKRASQPEALPDQPEAPEKATRTTGPRRLFATLGATVVLAVGFGWYLWKTRAAAPAPPTSVVVLPFVDMSPAKDQEYFSDGLTEEIIDALSRVPRLHVVARTSAFAYKGKANDIRKIAEQLNVDSVLEGSVRKSGNALRITAQLNRATDGFHLWSRTYDRPLGDIFAVQTEISREIAKQLRTGDVTPREPTSDLEAYRLYLEGRFFFNQFSPEGFEKAIERYQDAIALDPKFALAYAALADAYSYKAEFGIAAPRQVMPKAKEAASQAVSLDPSSGEAHTALGLVKLDFDWDRRGARQEFQRAAELNPSSSWVHHWLGHLAEAEGRLGDAIAEMRSAMKLDPLSMPLYWDLGWDLTLAKDYPEAVKVLDSAIELFPPNPATLITRLRLAFRMGDQESIQRKLPQLASFPDNPMTLAYVNAIQHRKREATEALQRLEQLREKEYVDAMGGLDTCLTLGDQGCAALWLKRAYEERSTIFVYAPLYFGDQLSLATGAAALLAAIR